MPMILTLLKLHHKNQCFFRMFIFSKDLGRFGEIWRDLLEILIFLNISK
jgi:hypothetical protein